MFTSSDALHLSAAIGSVAVIIGSMERLAMHRHLSDGALASWPVSTTSVAMLTRRPFQRSAGRLLAYPRVLGLVAVCLACGVLLALRPSSVFNSLAAGMIAVTYILLSMRSRFGGDGADQLTIIVFASLALAFGIGQERANEIVLWFLAAQVCLAYFTAGAAKLVSPSWRSGAALPGILTTQAYGHPQAGKILVRHRGIATAACWSVILLECGFPLALLGIRPLTYALLISGALLHIGTAVLMRLSTFPWAFVATYPAVIFCATGTGM
ncbi:HTTM domain-containing protein [Nocardia sp. NPDC059195]|uniref:HTTM domain-containing protein n=1 Tax=Nocardia sp. NPDC059195 TaxID=3346765 RepID=UPI00367F7760